MYLGFAHEASSDLRIAHLQFLFYNDRTLHFEACFFKSWRSFLTHHVIAECKAFAWNTEFRFVEFAVPVRIMNNTQRVFSVRNILEFQLNGCAGCLLNFALNWSLQKVTLRKQTHAKISLVRLNLAQRHHDGALSVSDKRHVD